MSEPHLRTFRGNASIRFVHALEADQGVSAIVWLATSSRQRVQTIISESMLRVGEPIVSTVEPPFEFSLAVRYFASGPAEAKFRFRTEMSQEGDVAEIASIEGVLDTSGRADFWALLATDRMARARQTDPGYVLRLWSDSVSVKLPSKLASDADHGARGEISSAKVETRDYTVWFGTNRTPKIRGDKVIDFAPYRSDVVRFGRCRVSVPNSHKIGSLGSNTWTRIRTRVDDRLKLAGIRILPAEPYWAEIRRKLSRVLASKRDAVVFLHGYSTTFGDAALRAAQLGVDLGISGVMAFYSWPSKGRWFDYAADAASIEASEGAITDYLTAVGAHSGAEKIHVIAHSMGNRALLRAVNRIAASASERSGRLFSQIILAAADVDADSFRSLSAAYARVAERTTMYVAPKDKALRMSGVLHSFPRAGFTPPVVVVRGIDTVSLEDIDLMGMGHGYVGEMRELLTDIYDLLRNGTSPDKRFGLRAAACADGSYWVMSR
jgi:esterase/lipase superfamily enzyme